MAESEDTSDGLKVGEIKVTIGISDETGHYTFRLETRGDFDVALFPTAAAYAIRSALISFQEAVAKGDAVPPAIPGMSGVKH